MYPKPIRPIKIKPPIEDFDLDRPKVRKAIEDFEL
jgi:hypothetical protein